MIIMVLEGQIRDIALGEGADFFGVADLTQARDEIVGQGGEWLAAYPRAISVGIRLLDDIVDQLPNRDRADVAVSYRSHAYDVVNCRLNQITLTLANSLQRRGYRAYPVPASLRFDDERICAVVSQKLAAHLAGLGWIGKSCLLITPEAGPRVRFATVLTDAPLPTGKPLDDRCGDCSECVEACPIHAFTGRNFREGEPREARFDAARCDMYFKAMETQGKPAICGMCLNACPYGKRK